MLGDKEVRIGNPVLQVGLPQPTNSFLVELEHYTPNWLVTLVFEFTGLEVILGSKGMRLWIERRRKGQT